MFGKNIKLCSNQKQRTSKINISLPHKKIAVEIMENTIITLTNENNQYVDLVKAHTSEEMYNIKDFVHATNYNIDPLIIDEQWNMLNTRRLDELILLTPSMIKRLNFSRIPNLIKKLEQLFPFTRKDKTEYCGDDVNVSIVLAVPSGTAKKRRGGAHSFKQIKMTKGAYKQLLMETQTDAARQVRKYYICLEELFVQYLLYQRAYEIVKAERIVETVVFENKALSSKLDIVITQNKEQEHYLQHVIEQNKEQEHYLQQVIIQNKKLSIQNEGLSDQLNIQDRKLETLSQILYNESNNKVLDVINSQKKQELVVLQNRDDPEKCEVLRGQHVHVQTQLKRKQDQMEVIGKVNTYKNPINLYNRFSEQTKKQKDSRFDVLHNKVTLKNGTTPTELLHMFNTLDDQKHSVAEQVQINL